MLPRYLGVVQPLVMLVLHDALAHLDLYALNKATDMCTESGHDLSNFFPASACIPAKLQPRIQHLRCFVTGWPGGAKEAGHGLPAPEQRETRATLAANVIDRWRKGRLWVLNVGFDCM